MFYITLALIVALVIYAVVHHMTLAKAHATINRLVQQIEGLTQRLIVARSPLVQTVSTGQTPPPPAVVSGPAANTPIGAVAGQISQNGVTDAQRLAQFQRWKAAHAAGGRWRDPWMVGRDGYAYTTIGPNDTAPPSTL